VKPSDHFPAGSGAAIVTLEDYRALARAAMPEDVFSYIDSGAGDEVTCRANRSDLDALSLRPLCARDVSAPAIEIQALGSTFAAPIGFSPTAFHRLVHADGEVATARAAKALDAPMILSVMSSVPLEVVATASGNKHLWLQLYIFKDRALTRDLVRRAEAAGFKAIVLTLAAPAPGKRDRHLRSGFTLPHDISAANFDRAAHDRVDSPIYSALGAELDPSITWRDVEWLRNETRLPVIVKGIMNPSDVPAVLALQLAGLIVSNHGGRQLDTTASTISVLPEIAEAAAGRTHVFVDSGFRRGTDVLKALALGADCVFIGRPVLWALAAGGESGVIAATTLLADELRLALQLAGMARIDELRRDSSHLLVRKADFNSRR